MSKNNKKESNVVPILDMPSVERRALISNLIEVHSIQSKTNYSWQSKKIDGDDQAEMKAYVLRRVSRFGCNVETDAYGNIYATKGSANTYPCVVAHLDTVHALIPKAAYRVYSGYGKLWAMDIRDVSRTGVGGDDNVGIFLALECLAYFPAIKVAFFLDEESGCTGSSRANIDWFKDCSFILQGDRRGYHDFVNEIGGCELYSKEFFNAIEPVLQKYNKRESSGGITDVGSLASNGVGISVANCSCGYYDPHTKNEYVIVDEALLTYQLFRDIILKAYVNGERWEHKRKEVTTKYGRYGSYGGYGSDWYGDDYYGYGYNRTNWKGKYKQPTKTQWKKVGDTWYKDGKPYHEDNDKVEPVQRSLFQTGETTKKDLELDEQIDETINETEETFELTNCPQCGATAYWDSLEELYYCPSCEEFFEPM